MREDLIDTKIRVNSEEESERIQNKLFSVGCRWNKLGEKPKYTNYKYLFINSDYKLGYTSDDRYFKEHRFREITIDEIFRDEYYEIY